MKKVELLAPAGSLKKLKIALAYGADAVYIGLPAFSLRAKTDFDLHDIGAGIDYAHKLGKKVYITINIFAHNRHIKLLPHYLRQLKKYQPDAIIVSDPGILNIVKKILPKISIHLSTQMNTLNYEAVRFWQKQGVSRIILGREVSLKDIKEIHRRAPKMELEMFVHGAMCMSYSGRCYLSAYFNQRSANLGLCTQPCRWEYGVYLEEPQKPGQLLKVTADENGTYIMNSKDLNLIDYLPELIKAGVISFKIEGRTKSLYYLAVATRAYRQALDLLTQKHIRQPADTKTHPPAGGHKNTSASRRTQKHRITEIKNELNKIDNRGYTTGFLLGNEADSREEFTTAKAVSDWEFVGEVVRVESRKSKVYKVQMIYIKPHNALNAGEEVEIITPTKTYKVKLQKFFDKNGQAVSKIRGGTEDIYAVEISAQYDIVDMSLIRKVKSKKNE